MDYIFTWSPYLTSILVIKFFVASENKNRRTTFLNRLFHLLRNRPAEICLINHYFMRNLKSRKEPLKLLKGTFVFSMPDKDRLWAGPGTFTKGRAARNIHDSRKYLEMPLVRLRFLNPAILLEILSVPGH